MGHVMLKGPLPYPLSIQKRSTYPLSNSICKSHTHKTILIKELWGGGAEGNTLNKKLVEVSHMGIKE